MELDYLKTLPLGGFNYDNSIRNQALVESGIAQAPKTMKTGTTICGIIFKVSKELSSLGFYTTKKANLNRDPIMILGWSLPCS